jgi:hypothetical protein
MISLPHFLGAFTIGILFVYLLAPAPTLIVKFPTPFNAGKVTYEDKANTCYQYTSDKVECPASGVLPQPIIEDFAKEPLPHDKSDTMFSIVHAEAK